MEDPDKNVAITAAEAMAVHETGARQRLAVDFLVEHSNLDQADFYIAVAALNALDRLPSDVDLPYDKISQFPRKTDQVQRGGDYVQRLIEKVTNPSGGR